jgi:hypothetical protein
MGLGLGLGLTSGPEELVIDEEVQTLQNEESAAHWNLPRSV